MATILAPPKKIPGGEVDGNNSLHELSLSLLSSELYESTQALQYVNSLLVAHGFARSPGLSLEGLAIADSERLVKCLLSMLSQRVEDLSRTEEQGSKLRTVTYEYERLQSMHRTAVDHSANAEREMNLFKTKLAASQRSLTSEASAHKQTLSDLQRTRVSLQYLRSTCQNELKRKDKEIERVLDRWNKICDSQVKLGSIQSGLRCANYAVGVEEHIRGKGFMEDALEQSEKARSELMKENEGFKSVILCTANALQKMSHDVMGNGDREEPTLMSHEAVFAPPTSSLSHSENAYIKIRELTSALREAVSSNSQSDASSGAKANETEEEISKLKDLVTSLRNELNESRQSSNIHAAEGQEILDRYTTHASERMVSGRDPTAEEAADMSMELIGVPECDDLREMLEKRAKQLEADRVQFTEATLKLGKERAALQAERLELVEEKRRWAVEQMLSELPSTPGRGSDLMNPSTRRKISPPPPVQSRNLGVPRGRLKTSVKKMAQMRRMPGHDVKSDVTSPGRKLGMRREGAAFETVEVLYHPDNAPDAEPQRSTTPEDPPPTVQLSVPATEMKTSLPLVLPTTFTLPPPSPASSFAVGELESTVSNAAPSSQASSSSNAPDFNSIPLTKAARHAHTPFPRAFPSPRTPRPLGTKHAYSPARPSPLSRILMLADSPLSPPSVPPIPEEDEGAEENDNLDLSTLKHRRNTSLDEFAHGLKTDLLIDEPSPLREQSGGGDLGLRAGASSALGNGALMNIEERRFTTKEKGKGHDVFNGISTVEKENVIMTQQHPRTGNTKNLVSSNVKPPKLAGLEMRNARVPRKASTKSLATTTGPSKHAAAPSGPPALRPQMGIPQSGGVGVAGGNVTRHGGGGKTKRGPSISAKKI